MLKIKKILFDSLKKLKLLKMALLYFKVALKACLNMPKVLCVVFFWDLLSLLEVYKLTLGVSLHWIAGDLELYSYKVS